MVLTIPRLLTRLLFASMVFLSSAEWLRGDEPAGADLEEQQILAAAEKVAPSVVRIETLGGLEKVGQLLVGEGPTTGLVVHPDGLIISSAFNFVQQPSSILVTLPGGKRAAAEIVARDRSRMLVLLKVKTEEKLPVPLAVPRGEMAAGQWTIALGRTFEGTKPNLSVGVLSATNRIWGKAIQTDAKISPSNYGGPLIDLKGRVLGVLVPASPQGQGEIAGAEWYDSGIGFAAPLVDILARLETLRQGKDLHAGLLGVSLKGTNVQVDPAEISACPANSPAAQAGLKAGDKIVSIDGGSIQTLAQLRHALGPHYAGDKVRVSVMRGDQKIDVEIVLVEKVQPYQHPFLGVLPIREADRDKPGVVVRYVYPASPAAEGRIQAGDRLLKVGAAAVRGPMELQDLLARHEVGQSVSLTVETAGKSREVSVKLAAIPAEVPGELPPAHGKPTGDASGAATGEVTIKLPEEKSEAVALVPASYHPDVPHGVLVWLHGAGNQKTDELFAQWKEIAAERDLIVLAPKSLDKTKWDPTEAAFIRKSIDDLAKKYNVDRTRVVVGGEQAGGAMSYIVAQGNRDLVRGVAAVDAPLPARLAALDNEPTQRLAFFLAWPKESKSPQPLEASAKRLQDAKFPVATLKLPGEGHSLPPAELRNLARWIDALDRG